jgi:hypothetical protein
LSVVDYHNLMLNRLDEASDERMKILGEIERDKLRVARSYNNRLKEKSFQVRDLIFGRRFCIVGPKVTSSGSDRQLKRIV